VAEQDEKGAGEEAGAEKQAGGKSKLMLIAGAALVLLLAGGGGAAYFMGWFGHGEVADAQQGHSDNAPSVYFDMPEMVVNLASSHDRAQYLKLKVALEADSQANIDALQPKLPRVQDMFLIYLREMRRGDLEGSAAVYRLKQELTRRINIAIYPATIKRVLFKEMILQ
jgi:flagellar FliL protein